MDALEDHLAINRNVLRLIKLFLGKVALLAAAGHVRANEEGIVLLPLHVQLRCLCAICLLACGSLLALLICPRSVTAGSLKATCLCYQCGTSTWRLFVSSAVDSALASLTEPSFVRSFLPSFLPSFRSSFFVSDWSVTTLATVGAFPPRFSVHLGLNLP